MTHRDCARRTGGPSGVAPTPQGSVAAGASGYETVHACPLCGSHDHALERRVPSHDLTEQFAIRRCAACGLAFVSPRPSQSEIDAYYPSTYHRPLSAENPTWWLRVKLWLQYCALQTRWGWPARLPAPVAMVVGAGYGGFLGRAVPFRRDGTLLDVGCGNGDFLRWVRQMGPGWTASGIDTSAAACRMVRNAGLICKQGTLEDQALAAESVDVVTMWNVLEHLHDPLASLCEVWRVLRPGGFVAMVVPNYHSKQRTRFGDDWWVYQVPQHLVFFSLSTAAEALRRSGFEVIDVSARRVTYSHLSVERRARRAGSKAPRLRLAVERLLDLGRKGDVIRVIGRKPSRLEAGALVSKDG